MPCLCISLPASLARRRATTRRAPARRFPPHPAPRPRCDTGVAIEQTENRLMHKSMTTLALLCALATPAYAADTTTQKQLDELTARIKALETNAQQLRDEAAAALAAAKAARDELD